MKARKYDTLIMVGLLFPLLGCARVQPITKDVFREGDLRVSLLEERERSGEVVPKGFDHPWEVDIQTLHRLLSSVNYQKPIFFFKTKLHRALPEKELDDLLPHLQKAFMSATPDHYIDFSLRYRKTWAIFQRRYLTDGLLFRKDDKLHIAFRNIAFEEGGSNEDAQGPFVDNPTSKPLHGDWSFVLGEGQELEYADKPGLLGSKTYPNWIKLDLSYYLKTPPPAVHEKKQTGTVVSSPETAQESTGVAKPLSRKEVEEKLRFLDELRKQDLISPESFDEKRDELLRQLKDLPH